MKFTKLNEAIEIAQRLQARLEQIANDAWENDGTEWKGSEDYSDAISYVADIFNGIAAEMLAESYKGADDISVGLVMHHFGEAKAEEENARFILKEQFQLIPSIDNI